MRKGNDSDVIQASLHEIKEREDGDFSTNLRLIEQAQADGGESSAAMRATERLLCINRGLLRNVAARFLERGIPLDDLMQIGTIGMIKAIRSFDVSRGTQFSTYAFPLIFGEIRRYVRDDGLIKVGRQYKRLAAMIMNERNRILVEEGRDAHISELAETLGVSVEEAAMAVDAASPVVSLSDRAYNDDDGVELEDVIADVAGVDEAERIIDKIALAEAISTMPQMWQRIVALRFFRGLTQSRTAELCGVTQVKISREEKKLLEYLRTQLTR